MKIVHIITRMIIGGAMENTLLTCEGLHRRGHDVTLITGPALGPEGTLMDRARGGGYRLEVLDQMRRAINPARDWSTYRRLVALLCEIAPEVVHTHASKAGILGRKAARSARVPIIIHTIHGLPFHPFQNPLVNRLYVRLERHCARICDKLICVADAMAEQALAAKIAAPKKFVTIRSGMEVDTFLSAGADREQLRSDLGIVGDDIAAAVVARLFHLKGHEYVIEAVQKLQGEYPMLKVVFIGDGILRDELTQDITRRGLKDRFIFTGLVDPVRIPGLLHAVDMVVHPSLREGLARVLPQGLLCGKPVISFDVDGAGEVVVNDQTGYLVAAKDVGGLIIAMAKLLQSPQRRNQLGKIGRQRCREMFDADIMVEKIERIYHECEQ